MAIIGNQPRLWIGRGFGRTLSAVRLRKRLITFAGPGGPSRIKHRHSFGLVFGFCNLFAKVLAVAIRPHIMSWARPRRVLAWRGPGAPHNGVLGGIERC
jgi:hypothetical protein